uniref:NB-ARC domain-containing protein n=1 Tax=Arundo donax TaxID=35708 RepID=A0A0A8YJG0_ARUDO
MDEHEWRSFYNQLNWQLTHNRELNWVSSVLNLSLNDLPAHLKNCFLYCGLFPEDYRIRRKWIIRLWIAEGFVEDRGAETTSEEVAEDYIKELTQRSLIQVVERNEFGRPKRFRLHDLVREITLNVSRKERFALICNNPDVTNLGDAARRVSVHSGGQVFEPGPTSQQLRSFLLFDKHVPVPWIHTASSGFRLLRVLCLRYSILEVVPNAVSCLFNLYYLDMSCTKVKKIPRSVAKLKNLQTLHLRFARVANLPRAVTTLTSLRHLSVSNDLFGTSIPGNICGLKSLQTLREVKASKDLVKNLGHLTQLRSLGITG